MNDLVVLAVAGVLFALVDYYVSSRLRRKLEHQVYRGVRDGVGAEIRDEESWKPTGEPRQQTRAQRGRRRQIAA